MKLTSTLGWTSVVALWAACQANGTPERAAPTSPEHPLPVVVGGERTVDVVQDPVEAAALGFKPLGEGELVAGHRTHRALLRGGVASITPYSWDTGAAVGHEALVLETASLTLDDTGYDIAATGTRVEAGRAIIARGDALPFEEIFRNDPEGVEQSWRFPSEPAYTGDLTVEVSATGQRFVASTDSGLHFKSATGAGLRYSHAVWIDANGAEYPIPAVYDSGRIRITVPAEVLEDTAWPAVLDPTISAESEIDTPIIATTGANAQNPAVAFDGTNHLVVWSDNRDSQDDDIWGARVNQAGTILDTAGIRIATAVGKQLHPTVAYTGTQYVVAWEDFRTAGGTQADIDAARVSLTGVVTALPFVSATATSETGPRLATRGGNTTFLVWNANGDLRGAPFTGTFGAAVNVAVTAALETAPAIAANPAGDYLVTFSEGVAGSENVRGQRINAAGVLQGGAFDISAAAGAQLSSTVAWNGTSYVVAWTNNNLGVDIYGTRVSTANVVLDTRTEGAGMVGGKPVTVAANSQEFPAIACATGGACTILWQDRRNLATTGFDLYAQRVTSAFALDGGEFVVSNANQPQFTPAVITRGSSFYAVWQDGRAGNASQIYGSSITTAGGVGPAANVVTGNNRETGPSIGRAAGIFGIFFADSRNDTDIQLIRYNANGAKLDTTSRAVSGAAFAQITPSASTDLGGNYFVVWADTRGGLTKDIYGARVSNTGAVLDASGVPISQAANNQLIPDVASNGTTVALVVWQDGRNGATDIYGALVNANGAVLVNDIAISTATGNQSGPSVDYDPASGDFLVVWSDARTAVSNIFGTRVSSAGVVRDPSGVQISSSAVGAFSPALASGPQNSLVVWDDRRGGTRDIYGARITGSGGVLGVLDPAGVGLSATAGNQTTPHVANIGASYIAVWTDDRAGNLDIYGQQLNFAGGLSGPNFIVSAGATDESAPTITGSTSPNNARIAYQKARPDLSTTRVATRTLVEGGPTGGTCSNDGQCVTGFCRDGKCCNTTCGGANNLTDCQACSASKTGGTDGICAPIASGTVCRNFANPSAPFCDLREQCNGVATTCPADVGRNQGVVCNAMTGTVCPSNTPAGAPHVCP